MDYRYQYPEPEPRRRRGPRFGTTFLTVILSMIVGGAVVGGVTWAVDDNGGGGRTAMVLACLLIGNDAPATETLHLISALGGAGLRIDDVHERLRAGGPVVLDGPDPGQRVQALAERDDRLVRVEVLTPLTGRQDRRSPTKTDTFSRNSSFAGRKACGHGLTGAATPQSRRRQSSSPKSGAQSGPSNNRGRPRPAGCEVVPAWATPGTRHRRATQALVGSGGHSHPAATRSPVLQVRSRSCRSRRPRAIDR